jgi:hypothetical protein
MVTSIDRAVEPQEIIGVLRAFGLSQGDIAVAASVSDRTVRAWKANGHIGRDSEVRLHELRQVVLLLQDSLTPRGVGQWLRAPNRLLAADRPLDALRDGRAEEVRKAAAAFAEGAYV